MEGAAECVLQVDMWMTVTSLHVYQLQM